jgi:DNA-binding NarL/FixJ family response regulator
MLSQMQSTVDSTSGKVANILIVDDHRLFAEGLSRLLETLDRAVVLEQCYSAQQAIQQLDRSNKKYDLLLIDLLMPGIDGIGLLRAIAERQISTPVAVVSSTDDTGTINQLMMNGAIGFIPKSVSSDVMLSAVTTLLKGDIYLPDELWGQLDFLDSGRYSATDLTSSQASLGERQIEVLRLMADGNTNKQISTILAISQATVKYHIGILFKALGVKNRTACIHAAQAQHYID